MHSPNKEGLVGTKFTAKAKEIFPGMLHEDSQSGETYSALLVCCSFFSFILFFLVKIYYLCILMGLNVIHAYRIL
jgi:hypothetical protein